MSEPTPQRRIELQGAKNVRDLGAVVTGDGRKVSPGRLLRGDGLGELTESDVAVLAGVGLRTVIDFRSDPEVQQSGADRLPAGVELVRMPIAGGNLGEMLAAMRSGDPARQHAVLGDGKAAAFMLEVNRQFVADASYRAVFARALHLIADPARRPVLFHCAAGKDRTGWLAAVVSTILGVPHEAVVADYLATNAYIWPAYQPLFRQLAAAGKLADPDLVKPLLFQDPAYLEAAFDEVRARYGSFDDFLVDGLGFTSADQDNLRSALLA